MPFLVGQSSHWIWPPRFASAAPSDELVGWWPVPTTSRRYCFAAASERPSGHPADARVGRGSGASAEDGETIASAWAKQKPGPVRRRQSQLVHCASEPRRRRDRRRIGEREFAEGDQISIDGESGRVFAGPVQINEERPTDDLAIVASWQTA